MTSRFIILHGVSVMQDGVAREERGVSLKIKRITPQESHAMSTQPWKGGKMGSSEVAADASTHLKGEGEPHCRWAIAGSGPLREKEEERVKDPPPATIGPASAAG